MGSIFDKEKLSPTEHRICDQVKNQLRKKTYRTLKIKNQLPAEKHDVAYREFVRIKEKNWWKAWRKTEKGFLKLVSTIKIDKDTQMTPPTERKGTGLIQTQIILVTKNY